MILLAAYLVAADHGYFNGEHILFQGHFSLENEWGKVESDKATLIDPPVKGSSRGELILEEKVKIHLREGTVDAVQARLFFEKEELVCDQPIGVLSNNPIRFRAEEMVWRRAENEIALHRNVQIEHSDEMRAEAEAATLTYREEFDFDELILNGQVHLFSNKIEGKESFALADALVYKPEKNLFILTAISPKKVLFWQNDVRLAATEVHIQRDPHTGNETVEGVGDVHFSFDVDEQNAMHEFFRNFL